MIKILFVCHGNIFRSPMAEFIMKDLVQKAGRQPSFTSNRRRPAGRRSAIRSIRPRGKLAEHGISCAGHAARQLTKRDYDTFDLLIGMDRANLQNMRRICGGDPRGSSRSLLEHAGRSGDVADPWYTGDFEATWRDVLRGCEALLKELRRGEMSCAVCLYGGKIQDFVRCSWNVYNYPLKSSASCCNRTRIFCVWKDSAEDPHRHQNFGGSQHEKVSGNAARGADRVLVRGLRGQARRE